MHAGKRVNGYITVYLLLTTGVFLSLLLTVLWGTRVQTMRAETELTLDMGVDSALAEYHRGLLDRYDLFFLDMSYGGSVPSAANVEGHIKSFMNRNFEGSGMGWLFGSPDLTALTTEEAAVQQFSLASDLEGAVLKRQIVEYMKAKTGLSIADAAAEYAGLVSGNEGGIEDQWDAAEAQVKEAIAAKQEERRAERKRREELGQSTGDLEEEPEVQLPTEEASAARSIGILQMVCKDGVSVQKIAVDSLLSHRAGLLKGSGMAPGNEPASGVAAAGLLRMYLMEKCGYYGHLREESSFSYQIEYLLSGQDSDEENLRAVARRILLVRETINAAYLFADGEKSSLARETALFLSTLLFMPELEEPLANLILLAWAFEESVKDVRMLMDGERVPIVKTADTWNTPYHHLLTFRAHLGEYRKNSGGMNYGDYLLAFLFLQKEQTTLFRLMDVMESDLRLTEGNHAFRMDGCTDGLEICASVKSRFGPQFEVLRNYKY